MTIALTLLIAQGVLGALDTLVYHELWARLPGTPSARRELRLHAARDFAYAILFGTLGWVAWHGALTWALAGLLLFEIAITLWDFIEEDRTRRLPAGERVMHSVMAILYGGFLANLIPELRDWVARPTAFVRNDTGPLAWGMSVMAAGVFLSGVRDLLASLGHPLLHLKAAGPPAGGGR
jgi:uncharacterized protein